MPDGAIPVGAAGVIPDDEIPATKNFCVNTNSTMMGTTESDAPASCMGTFAPPLDWKNLRAGVRSCLDVLLMNRNGSTKLFQMLMKENSTIKHDTARFILAGKENEDEYCRNIK